MSKLWEKDFIIRMVGKDDISAIMTFIKELVLKK